jgi:hypothetical protein
MQNVRRITKILGQYRRCLIQSSNQAPPELKTRALPVHHFSVTSVGKPVESGTEYKSSALNSSIIFQMINVMQEKCLEAMNIHEY